MAKFCGMVGYLSASVETKPDVWEEIIEERRHYGDVIRNSGRNQQGIDLNDDLVLNNMFSILADPYAMQNYAAIRYVTWMGNYWKVTNIEPQSPRIILTVGGIYNGPKA